MNILILNGPNLNLLGQREPDVYGNMDFETFMGAISEEYADIELGYFQSNVEGDLIDMLHQSQQDFDAVVFNGGGYTHTSVAIADAIAAITTPVIEVHISNIYAREEYRHVSLSGKNCIGVITGFGLDGYKMAIEFILRHTEK